MGKDLSNYATESDMTDKTIGTGIENSSQWLGLQPDHCTEEVIKHEKMDRDNSNYCRADTDILLVETFSLLATEVSQRVTRHDQDDRPPTRAGNTLQHGHHCSRSTQASLTTLGHGDTADRR